MIEGGMQLQNAEEVGNREERNKILRMMARRTAFIAILAIAAMALTGYSITLGTSGISATDAYKALVNSIFPDVFDLPDRTERIVLNLRAPRVVMAAACGAALAVGGCITQSLLKNPLATPYTLGVSSGAGFGAALAILFGMTVVGGIGGIIVNAFIFSLIPVAIVLIASRFRRMSPMTIILCGVAISYVFSASNTIFQFFGEANAVKSVVFWMVGDLNEVSLWNAPYVIVPTLAVFAISMFLSKDFNAMRMGDDTAKALGVKVEPMRMMSLIMACLLTAFVVSFTGSIGFICLLAPQMSRIFVGSEMQYLLPSSALMGSCLLSLADMAAKTIMAPIMLPVGALTALIGGPALIILLLMGDKSAGVRN